MPFLTADQERKLALTIWAAGWRIAAALLCAAAVIAIVKTCAPDDVAVPNETNTFERSDIVWPLCTDAEVGISETGIAVIDAIGSVPLLLIPTGVLEGTPDTDRLNISVGAAASVFFMKEENRSVKAGDLINVCVNEEGYIASVDNMAVPAM